MKNKIIIIIITILTVLIMATIFSIFKFQVINPFASCFSMLRILFTDTEYVEVQNYPKKVVFSKGNNSKTLLDEYMNSKGFYEISEEQMGSTLVYGNGQQKHFIYFSMNKYYSKWIWDNIETLPTDTININTSLPNDIGLTVNGVPKTFNQDIMAKANIAYLLGCENITDTTDLEGYIYNHIPNNGIFISERTVYKKTDNPYDYIKERKTMMKEMLASINLSYDIDKNNYLLGNKSNGQLEQQLNKLISGNKKIIIGFVADYYTYINDSEYGLQLGGGFGNSSYVSFKPYNEIYAYIFDENSADIDSFYTMIDEISNLAE